jgi:hypothetical protein
MKLIKLANNRYELNDGLTKIEGDWESTFNILANDWQIHIDEIRLALNWMSAANHNTAHFGVKGRCTNTSDSVLVGACMNQLQAIQNATERFHDAYKRNKDSKETHLAADDVKALWIALNIDGIMCLISDRYELRSMKKGR